MPAGPGTPGRARGGSNPPQALPASPRSAVPAPLRSPARYSSSFCPHRTRRAGPAAAAMAGGGTRGLRRHRDPAAAEHPRPAQEYSVSQGWEKGRRKRRGRVRGRETPPLPEGEKRAGKGAGRSGKRLGKGVVRGGNGREGSVRGREKRL